MFQSKLERIWNSRFDLRKKMIEFVIFFITVDINDINQILKQVFNGWFIGTPSISCHDFHMMNAFLLIEEFLIYTFAFAF